VLTAAASWPIYPAECLKSAEAQMLVGLATAIVGLIGLFLLFQNHAAMIDPAVAWMAAVAVAGILTAIYFVSLRSHLHATHKSGMAFVSLLLFTAGGGAWWYGLRGVAERREHQVPPGINRQEASSSLSVLVRRSPAGNFVAHGQINGTEALFLFDTGSSVVMLTPTDAERAGIDLKSLAFTVPVQSANGTLYSAPVRVRSISIGLLKVEDVEALVARPGSLNENLLGMSFLRRLGSYNFSGDFLTLRQ
jgi:aspartyl protease family protein